MTVQINTIQNVVVVTYLSFVVTHYSVQTTVGVTVNYGFSDHFPMLSTFLRLVCCALESHKFIKNLDEALCTGDFQSLMEITKVNDFQTLFNNELENSYEQCMEAADCASKTWCGKLASCYTC